MALAAAGEGGEQEQAKVTALALLTLSSSVQTFVPGRFARPGGETDVGFHKTHPSDCGSLLIPGQWLCWDRPIALPGQGPWREEGGILLKRSLLSLPCGSESSDQLRGLPPAQGSANWNCCRHQAGISHTPQLADFWTGQIVIPAVLSPAKLLQPRCSHPRATNIPVAA